MAAALAFLLRNWRLVLFGALAAALVLSWRSDAEHLRERDQARAATAAEQAAHRATVDQYQKAAAIAAQRDAENRARVTAAQAAINERISDDHQVRVERSAASYWRLRDQADAYRRGADDADVSAAREATCRAYAATSCDELPALLKAAQDNTDQLVALIAWAEEQAAVPADDGATP